MGVPTTMNGRTTCAELRIGVGRVHDVVEQAGDEAYVVGFGPVAPPAALGTGGAFGVGEAQEHCQPCGVWIAAAMQIVRTCLCSPCVRFQ